MPFSWKKKTRCTRFSQLVADHLQSPKHGGSLVVETGFPTSLIDLYVRNRGRFVKSSAKKQKSNHSPTPSLSSLSSSSGLFVDSNDLSSGVTDYRESDEIIEEDVVCGDGKVIIDSSKSSSGATDCRRDYRQSDEIIEEEFVDCEGIIEIEKSSITEVEASAEISKLNPVMVTAVKVLLMVVLALGTKRVTIGITLSAFLLFFLESVGKPLLGRSSSIRPSLDSKPLVESSFHETKDTERSKENTTFVVCSEVVEIEELESKQEVRAEKELDEAQSEVLMEIRHKSSRRAIMKSRMKKLVPKKLRKCSMASKGEISIESSDSKGDTFCILKQEHVKSLELEEQEEQALASTLSNETHCNNVELGNESEQNYNHLVLYLIVLIGLIGGRMLALVLALSWFLLLKIVQWRNVKLPIS